jgi:hypothetical protein
VSARDELVDVITDRFGLTFTQRQRITAHFEKVRHLLDYFVRPLQ